ncbi:TonB-dependent receptor domain-containing protein [Elongatibacter sediminis]|uniref:TonB-dependent receptor n=1 Tax=Elongatibacter sediminis TaxID=3119006 RepID=A0AAW9RII9_9GAMM
MTRRGSTEFSIWQILLLAFVLMFSGATLAQEESDDEDDSADLDRIAVTGSRIKRTDIEGPAQVITIDREQISDRGYTTVFEALSDLTINNGFKFEGPESALFTPDVQTLNLRGFGVGNTLVLINGRRLTNYPAAYQSNATVFNFGAIPIASVERIEVLAQGASAIYGSDAVAGVINIILRSDIDETTVNVLWGTPTETDQTRGDLRVQIMNGQLFDRGSYTFTLEYQKREDILGKYYDQYDDQQEDFPFGEGVYDRSALILDQFKSAFGVFPRYRDPAELGDPNAICSQSGGGLVYAFRPGAGNFCGDPDSGAPAVNFQNEKEAWSAYFNGKVEIGNSGLELFTDLMYYTSNAQSNNQWLFISEDILDTTQPDTVDFGFFDWYLVQRLWNEEELGMDLAQKFDEDAYTAVVGMRGVFADYHDWELSVNYSDYELKTAQPWLKWRETIDTMLGTHLGVSFFGDDWWSGGTLPGESLAFGLGDPNNVYADPGDALRNVVGTQRYDNNSDDLYVQFTMSGDLFEMKSGPVSYALVAEFEDSSIEYVPDELLQQRAPTTDANGDPIAGSLTGSGWWRLTGFNGAGDRERWSLGGEVRIPVLDTLTLNLAGRYDDYDSTSTSFGGDFTPSASLEFRPLSNLLLRAGYTESFRAPDMALVFLRSGFFTTVFDDVSCYEQYVFTNGSDAGFDNADCETSTVFGQRVGAQEFGEEPLDAETGDSWWLGFSWDILDNVANQSLNLTVDYTNMSLEQRVLQQSTQGLLNDEYSCFIGDEPSTTPCDVVAKQVQRKVDPTTGISFIDTLLVTSINQFEEEAEFIDVHLTYSVNTEAGIFQFDGLYNNMLSHTRRLTPTSTEADLKNDPIAGGWDFRSSFTGSLSWAYRDFATTLTAIYRGGSTVFNCSTATNGCTGNVSGEDYYATENWWVDSYTTFNLTASYNWTDELLTRIRIQNLFDEKPPTDDTHDFFDQPWYNVFVYSGAGIGRYAALELEYTF